MSVLNLLNFLEIQPIDSLEDHNSSIKIGAKLSNLVSNVQSLSLFWRPSSEIEFSKIQMNETEERFYVGEIPIQYDYLEIDFYLQFQNSYYVWYSPLAAPDSIHSIQQILTDIHEDIIKLTDFRLEQNYPNPFNPTTTIEFSLPNSSMVTLKIYNTLGEEIATLVCDKLASGKYKYKWDASHLPSGLYLYRLEAEEFVEIKKMIMLR